VGRSRQEIWAAHDGGGIERSKGAVRKELKREKVDGRAARGSLNSAAGPCTRVT
jgi:hypothetical protein